MEWKNLYRGFVMGISDLIPGVSGGTIAVVLGIYDRLIAALSGFFSREWKKHIGFLIPLLAGMGAAILSLSRVIEYLLEHYHGPTQFFFMGLIIGVLPLLLKKSEAKSRFKAKHIIIVLLAAAALGSLAFVNATESEPITQLTVLTAIGLFFSGSLASMAMLLPGISGSFILLILGVYSTAIHALSSMNILFIAVIGAGVVLGFVTSSKGIRYLFAHYPDYIYSVIIGLLIGSTLVIFPGLDSGWLGIVTFILGLGISFGLGMQGAKKP